MTARYTTRLFESLDALADFSASGIYCRNDSDTEWAGGTFAACIHRTRRGDLALAAQSEALLAKFESLSFVTPRREWHSEVTGHVPNVPAYLAGHPQAMRRRKRAPSDVAPIGVFVDLFASAAFDHKAILARGAAVLALVRILTAMRPVSLYVGCATTTWNRSGGSGFVGAKIDTTPLDLAHAAWAICGPGFLRQVIFNALEGVFPSNPFPPFKGSLKDLAAACLPYGTHTIVVDGIVSNVTKDPAAWIAARIREAAPEALDAGA